MLGPSRKNLEKQPASAKEESLELKKIILIEEELIEDAKLKPEEWVKKYGKSFREFINENPEFIKFWEKNKEEAKRKIKEALKYTKGG